MHPRGEHAQEAPRRPRFEVADVFRAHGEVFRQSHVLTHAQHRAMRAIENCRTAVLGGHVDVCADCGDERPSYNSCRNRHCPKCQALAQAQWLERQRDRILPTGYFHVVFTLPSELRSLCLLNQRLVYGLLFEAASGTLLTLGRDPKRLGGLLGLTAVLHTWTRDLRFHPHVHCIVTGGALANDAQGAPRWIDAGREYLFPVKVLSALFRGKLIAGLERIRREKELKLPRELVAPSAFDALVATLRRTRFVTYCKRPFAGPEQVFAYLGRYTHRVGLSNNRLLHVAPGGGGDDRDARREDRDNGAAGVHPALPASHPAPGLREDPALRADGGEQPGDPPGGRAQRPIRKGGAATAPAAAARLAGPLRRARRRRPDLLRRLRRRSHRAADPLPQAPARLRPRAPWPRGRAMTRHDASRAPARWTRAQRHPCASAATARRPRATPPPTGGGLGHDPLPKTTTQASSPGAGPVTEPPRHPVPLDRLAAQSP